MEALLLEEAEDSRKGAGNNKAGSATAGKKAAKKAAKAARKAARVQRILKMSMS